MANNQTSNISKVGIYLSTGDSLNMIKALMPLLVFFIGSIISSLIRNLFKSENKWLEFVVIFEIISFFFIGLIPVETSFFNNEFAKLYCCLISSFHLTAFRMLNGLTINSTICTGNIRNLGGLIANAIYYRTMNHVKLALSFFIVLCFFHLNILLKLFLENI